MGYLLAEIGLYLVGAGLIGFVVGWFVRGEFMTQTTEQSEEPVEKVSNVKEVEEVLTEKASIPSVDMQDEVKTEEKVVETPELINDEAKEPKVEAPVKEVSEVKVSTSTDKPTLFTEAPAEGKDKLSALKGIGPVLEKKLNELGVYSYEQIASWTTEQEIWIGTQMAFPKKVSKEEWVKQAKELLSKK